MKIKTRRPKLTMQQAIVQLEKIGKYLYFSSTVSIARMEHCVRQLKAGSRSECGPNRAGELL